MSHEIALEETRRSLDAHKQAWLGKRIVRRISGNYPSRAARRALVAHERENRKPYEKIRDSIWEAYFSVRSYNEKINWNNFGVGKVRTVSKLDKTIAATEAMPFDILRANKLVADLCTAGGRPELMSESSLTVQGFYVTRGKQKYDQVVGIYLADKNIQRFEKVPFSPDLFESMPADLQQAMVNETQAFADEARIRDHAKIDFMR